MDETSDWSEWLALLNANNVEYLIIGAHARAFHGSPRMTGDLDILVKPTRENGLRIIKALNEFGFGSLEVSADDFIQPDLIVQLGYPPRRIDLITGIDGVSVEDAFRGSVAGNFEGVPVVFISRRDFITNKQASGRLKDIADIDAIEGRN